jgi:hypothetical protein
MRTKILMLAAALAAMATLARADDTPKPKPEDTEFYKPVPPVVTPGRRDSDPPSDAIVLFDGKSLDEWVNERDKAPAGWTLADGVMTVNKPVGDILTKRVFTDYQLHLEWRIPTNVVGSGQLRGNSGVFLAAAPGGRMAFASGTDCL